jgi:peptidoglycan/LPS O-acetylase OafA/YrhL
MSSVSRTRFDTLDLLRGVAALSVVILHFKRPWGFAPLMQHGYLAVDLFFILSGFVIAHAYGQQLARGEAPLQFMLRRLIRLCPLYLLTLVAGAPFVFGIVLDDGTLARTVGQCITGLAANLFFLPAPPVYVGRADVLFPTLPPAWSLFWELIANLMFALLAPRLGWRLLALILGAGLILLCWAGATFDTLDAGPDWQDFWGGGARVLWGFFAGVALERIYAFKRIPITPSGALLAALLAVVLAQHQSGFQSGWSFDVLAAAILFPLLVLLAAQDKGTSRVGSWLGYISYALYVVHVPVHHLVDKGGQWLFHQPIEKLPVALVLPVYVFLSIGCAAVVTRHFDDPVRAWLGRLTILQTRRLATP